MLLDELERVLLREKFAKYMPPNVSPQLTVQRYVQRVSAAGVVYPDPIVVPRGLTRDPDDDYLLAFAASIGAVGIISGDKDLLSLSDAEPPIFSPRDGIRRFVTSTSVARGPGEVAVRFAEAIFERGDALDAWRLVHPESRLAFAQDWCYNNHLLLQQQGYDPRREANALAVPLPNHPLWIVFAAMQLQSLREAWPGFSLDEWGMAGNTRILGPGLEIVVFIRQQDVPSGQVVKEQILAGRPLVMRHSDNRWWVAGVSELPPEPGWPPARGDRLGMVESGPGNV